MDQPMPGDFYAFLDPPVFPLLGGIDPYGFAARSSRRRCLRCLPMFVPRASTPQARNGTACFDSE